MVPVWLGVPLLVSSIPPLMISIPAMLALRPKVMPTVARLGALRAVLGDRIIESGFCLFDALAAFVSFVGVSAGGGDKKQERAHCYERGQSSKQTSTVPTMIRVQDFLL
jgi:hypothetical protein